MEYGPILLLGTAECLVACCFPADAHESSPKDVPNVLNTGQIRPVHSVHIVNTEKVVDDTSPMRSGHRRSKFGPSILIKYLNKNLRQPFRRNDHM